MGMFHKIQVGDDIITPIDWEMSPDLSFGTYESWGGRERVRNNDECVYYFFVDNWGETPKLCLMERAVKHAKVIAEVKAPKEMVAGCVAQQGESSRFERSYAINEAIKSWLIDHVLDDGERGLVVALTDSDGEENMGRALPKFIEKHPAHVLLPSRSTIIRDEELQAIMDRWNFYDHDIHQSGTFANNLLAYNEEIVVDSVTGLMWQRGGLDIASIRTMQRQVTDANSRELAGFNDWRLPTLEEAMSLMESKRNDKGLFLHPCFSKNQPFIFVAAQRKPGGYWFVDYKQGRAFWSSGTIPGGFGRLVRTI